MTDIVSIEAPARQQILFIDDEKNVLLALQRQLRKDFNTLTATSFDEAVKMVETSGPIAVAVCDMRMPGRDGIETLSAIEKLSPDTIRVMLTGNADQETAVDAINRGHIFRFLTKPCNDDVLRATLRDALRQHQLVTAEKSLLQDTLTGSVRLLVDVLSMMAPEAFSRASRARQWVKPIVQELGLANRWDIELATMLAPLGIVTIPPEVATKVSRKMPLSPEEKAMLARVPETGSGLLGRIPRLRNVAQWVALQSEPVRDDIPVGARIVKLLTDLSTIVEGDVPNAAAFAALRSREHEYDPSVLAAARRLWASADPMSEPQADSSAQVRSSLAALQPNDLLLEPIVYKSGKLLLAAGARLSAVQIERLRNLRTLEPIVEPIAVTRLGPLH